MTLDLSTLANLRAMALATAVAAALCTPAGAQGIQPAAPSAAVAPAAGPPPGPGQSSGPTMTLDQVVALALANNSTVALARERLRKAQEQIQLATAQALPQISASLTDSYTSQKTFSAQGGGTGISASIPTNIPVIVDQGGTSTGIFVAGGGATTGPVPSGSAAPTLTTPTTTTTTMPTGTSGSQPTTAAPSAPGGTVAPAPAPQILQSLVESQRPGPANSSGLGSHASTPAATGTNSTSNNFSSGGHNNYSGRLSINQAVDIFGLVPASVDVLHRTRDFYAIDLERVTNELALSVKNTFYNVLLAQANVAVQQEQVDAATENVRITKAKFDQGTVAEFDVLTAQTTLANDNQALISAQNQLDIARANLNSVLGTNLDQPIGLVEPPQPATDTLIDLPSGVQTAYKNRPELRQADNNVVIAQKLVKLAGAGLLPSMSISGAASYNGPSYPGITQDNYSVTANLTIPLYDGGATHSRVQSAQSDLRTQIITRDQLRQNVALEVRQAYLNVMTGRASTSAATLGVSQAAEAARLANVRFTNGRGTFLDVINAEAQLATARTNLANAQFNYQTSLAQLTRAEGSK